MSAAKELACAATGAVALLAIAAFCCVVATAPAQRFTGAPTTLALAGQSAAPTHFTEELK